MQDFSELRNKIHPILEPYGVERVALFGSVVRGEQAPESDIDILVDFEEPRKKPFSLFTWIEVEEDCQGDWEEEWIWFLQKDSERVRSTVEREMVVLYEKTRRPRTIRRHSRRNQTHRFYMRGASEKKFENDLMRHDAIMLQIEIIGEATRNISPGFQEQHPEIPWSKMIGMRNKIVHDYFEIDMSKIWDTATNGIPQLKRAVSKLLKQV